MCLVTAFALSTVITAVPRAAEGYDAESLPQIQTVLDVSIPDPRECAASAETLPGLCFFATWKRPWRTTGEAIDPLFTDRALTDIQFRDSVEDDFAAAGPLPVGPFLAFTAGEMILTETQALTIAAFRNRCPECWTVRRLAAYELRIVQAEAEAAGISDDWRYSVTFADLWSDAPTLNQSLKILADQGYPWSVAFLSPSMLTARWAPNRVALMAARLDHRPIDDEPVPAVVRWALRDNPEWIAKAVEIVRASGKTWSRWFAEDGWIPGSRDAGDMVYNYALRWPTRDYLRESYEPFGRVMPWGFDYGDGVDENLFDELERRWISDEREAADLVDRYLGRSQKKR